MFTLGRADGVAVYLKKGASLVLAKVLGTDKVFGPNIKSWEDRNMLLNRMAADAASATVALKKKNVMAELEQSVPAVTTLSPKKQKI